MKKSRVDSNKHSGSACVGRGGCYLFNTLSATEIQTLQDKQVFAMYKKGEKIFKQTKEPMEVFCIEEGIVKLSTRFENSNRDQILRLYKAGELFGYRSILAQENYRYDAIAVEDTKLSVIPKALFVALLHSNPHFTAALFQKIACELEQAEHKIVAITQTNIRGRIADALLFLFRYHGEKINQHNIINIRFSREEMANFVGTATETAIRTISDFQKEKLIKINKRSIEIINFDALVYISKHQ